jgi:hypothetical protein
VPVTTEPDTYYNVQNPAGDGEWDKISTIFHSEVSTSDPGVTLTSSLYGRYYDSDPTRIGEWGLLNREVLTGDANPPWLVKHGLAPTVVGNPDYNNVIANKAVNTSASYVAVKVSADPVENPDGVLFDSASLTITGFYNTDTYVQVWAATNQGDYTQAVTPIVTFNPLFDTDVYTFNFQNLNFIGKDLEIHIFGILGQDEGTFGIMSATGTFTTIPEPASASLLVGLAALFGARRRRVGLRK